MWKNEHLLKDFEIDIDEPVFTTGVVSRLLEMPVWVLKHLDRERVIRPVRERGRDRLYSKRELKQLHHVWFLMEKRKVTINGIKVILEIESGTFKHK